MTFANEKKRLKIRRARRGDIAKIAELATQLGYPSTAQQIAKRMNLLRPKGYHEVFLADAEGAGVVGWLHVSVEPQLEVDLRAEVNGLIVADGQRSLGAGARLLDAAESWARGRGCKSMSVRSNVIRERAHKFYERNGYEHYKTQKAFRKPL
jgi:GNAT superfamily N-acetyltransferase